MKNYIKFLKLETFHRKRSHEKQFNLIYWNIFTRNERASFKVPSVIVIKKKRKEERGEEEGKEIYFYKVRCSKIHRHFFASILLVVVRKVSVSEDIKLSDSLITFRSSFGDKLQLFEIRKCSQSSSEILLSFLFRQLISSIGKSSRTTTLFTYFLS